VWVMRVTCNALPTTSTETPFGVLPPLQTRVPQTPTRVPMERRQPTAVGPRDGTVGSRARGTSRSVSLCGTGDLVCPALAWVPEDILTTNKLDDARAGHAAPCLTLAQ
jgi:hypothetical protein